MSNVSMSEKKISSSSISYINFMTKIYVLNLSFYEEEFIILTFWICTKKIYVQ